MFVNLFVRLSMGLLRCCLCVAAPKFRCAGWSCCVDVAGLMALWTAQALRRDLGLWRGGNRLETWRRTLWSRRSRRVRCAQFRDFGGCGGAGFGVDADEEIAEQGWREPTPTGALLDSMQDAVVAVDAAGRIQWTNERMQRMLARRGMGGSGAGGACAGADDPRSGGAGVRCGWRWRSAG